MAQPPLLSGCHHLALVCKDMKKTIDFYEKALGYKLLAVYPMHKVPGAKHCFLDAGGGMQLSFVQFDEPRQGVPGVSFPATNASESPVGTIHHMALKADTLENLYRTRERIKAYGVKASKVIDHKFIHSFYFTDPNGFHLECTCTTRAYSAEEMMPEILDRKLRSGENDWDEPAAMQRAAKLAPKL